MHLYMDRNLKITGLKISAVYNIVLRPQQTQAAGEKLA